MKHGRWACPPNQKGKRRAPGTRTVWSPTRATDGRINSAALDHPATKSTTNWREGREDRRLTHGVLREKRGAVVSGSQLRRGEEEAAAAEGSVAMACSGGRSTGEEVGSGLAARRRERWWCVACLREMLLGERERAVVSSRWAGPDPILLFFRTRRRWPNLKHFFLSPKKKKVHEPRH